MSKHPTQRTRAGQWHSSGTPISSTVSSVRTDDPLTHAMTAPTPVLHLVFGGETHGDIKLVQAGEKPSSAVRSAPRDSASDDRDAKSSHPNRIELGIDSLPNYVLIEPIPVAIDPVGDDAFTAWIPNLDANATGSSVVEALLMLKERIESVYDDLNKRAHLTNEQKMTLQMLHTYIAPKRPDWE